MRSFLIIAGGFVLVLVFAMIGRVRTGKSGGAKGALAFIPLWFALAAANLAVGVIQAGYTVAEEAPIFLLIFLPPALFALYLWKTWRSV
jgi:hypothetical protein